MKNAVRCAWAMMLWTIAAAVSAQTPIGVVEYYNVSLDSYFITGRANEQASLDSFPASFSRTGASFGAISAESATTDLEQICRFYVSTPAPNYTSTHFYGTARSDCPLILQMNPAGFSYEGNDFAAKLPTGVACPVSHPVKVYRAFRPQTTQKSSNHRYTMSLATHGKMVAQGWADEGIAFCVYSATDVGVTVASTAAGIWTGKTNSNRNVFGLIAPDGNSWVMYTNTAGNNYFSGVVQGAVTWSGGTWTLNGGRDFSLESRSYTTVNANGSYSTRNALNGTLAYPAYGQTFSFTSAYSADAQIVPTLSAIAGTYTGQASSFLNTENASITINANGSASGTGASGCAFIGTVAPYPGIYLYTVSVTFRGGVCAAGTATLNGVAYFEPSVRRLYGLALNSARTTPFFFIGGR